MGQWSTGDQISAISLVASVVLGICSLGVSWWAIRTAKRKVLSRIEFDEYSTGTNGPDYENGWARWRDRFYIGVQRKAIFHEAFESIPKTSGNFYFLQLNSPEQIAKKIGYSLSAEEKRHLDGVHVVFWFDVNVKKEWMLLQAGVGLTEAFAEKLETYLEDYQPTKQEIAFARKSRAIKDRAGELSDEERWMLGFSAIVGHIGVNWVARENH